MTKEGVSELIIDVFPTSQSVPQKSKEREGEKEGQEKKPLVL